MVDFGTLNFPGLLKNDCFGDCHATEDIDPGVLLGTVGVQDTGFPGHLVSRTVCFQDISAYIIETNERHYPEQWRLKVLPTDCQRAKLLRRCETLWSAREIASMALSAEQARHTENVFHIALMLLRAVSVVVNRIINSTISTTFLLKTKANFASEV